VKEHEALSYQNKQVRRVKWIVADRSNYGCWFRSMEWSKSFAQNNEWGIMLGYDTTKSNLSP
jgi:hypothetical protein